MRLVITLPDNATVTLDGEDVSRAPDLRVFPVRNYDRELREALSDPRWTWRNLRTLAVEITGKSEEETATILRGMSDVRQAHDAPHLWGLKSRN